MCSTRSPGRVCVAMPSLSAPSGDDVSKWCPTQRAILETGRLEQAGEGRPLWGDVLTELVPSFSSNVTPNQLWSEC